MHFNPRILKAFHTALKTAEWSPITVLAGVSGTGKSELPRLYSHFGGLMYEPLSVQPNWDSQESMLGFFNSIDNKFDAQPVLRFLAQSQKSWEEGDDGYPGLEDAVCMILLDEMNLAHPELYWSEFLSKLETRRGKSGKGGGIDLPFIPVKIGAGMLPYELKLGRNVLWAGTMNQDETTKSLSDKVLDRSIIIHFPRPTTLKRRV
ncbi:MAG TPA: chromosome partitioning protein ParA, partial [Chromatiaceae bacterium]|nr:chromosome partitioning protein ParA [Chromatiaceae bacterium]